MSAPVLPFTVHKGGKRPKPQRQLPTAAQKFRRLRSLDQFSARVVEEMLDRLLVNAENDLADQA